MEFDMCSGNRFGLGYRAESSKAPSVLEHGIGNVGRFVFGASSCLDHLRG